MITGLERVARALCELDGHPANATMDGKPLWHDHLPEAWAAIMALREPDPAVLDAARLRAAEDGNDDFAGIHRAMIDAAIAK